MNPLFNALGGGQMPGALGNFQQMMQQFQQFKATFQGDPEQEVRKLIASGKISQNQLNQLQQAAQNQYLVNTIRPCPVPAYTVANPFCCNQAQYCAG